MKWEDMYIRHYMYVPISIWQGSNLENIFLSVGTMRGQGIVRVVVVLFVVLFAALRNSEVRRDPPPTSVYGYQPGHQCSTYTWD